MDRRFLTAMLAYAVLAVLAGFTLSGTPRIVTLLVLGLFALKTWIAVLKSHLD